MEKISRLTAIKKFFGEPSPPYKAVSNTEATELWKTLSETERQELGAQCAVALGCELQEKA